MRMHQRDTDRSAHLNPDKGSAPRASMGLAHHSDMTLSEANGCVTPSLAATRTDDAVGGDRHPPNNEVRKWIGTAPTLVRSSGRANLEGAQASVRRASIPSSEQGVREIHPLLVVVPPGAAVEIGGSIVCPERNGVSRVLPLYASRRWRCRLKRPSLLPT